MLTRSPDEGASTFPPDMLILVGEQADDMSSTIVILGVSPALAAGLPLAKATTELLVVVAWGVTGRSKDSSEKSKDSSPPTCSVPDVGSRSKSRSKVPEANGSNVVVVSDTAQAKSGEPDHIDGWLTSGTA